MTKIFLNRPSCAQNGEFATQNTTLATQNKGVDEWSLSEIKRFFALTDVVLTEEQAQKFCVYGEFLQQKNQSVNLTAITDRQGILQKHFLDSAYVAKYVPQNATLCDVGCGAGFPSVVVKIIRPDVKITAVDSVGKKTAFVAELLQRLGVEGQTANMRAEELAKQNREAYDVVCARAVAELPTLLEYLAPLAKVGGLVLAQKSRESQAEQAKATYACNILGLELIGAKEFCLPNGDNRVILQYKKVLTTPKKYPRGQNAPRKNPLCFANETKK